MRDWPPITEPELLERLAMDDEQFFAQIREVARTIGSRDYQRDLYVRALGYPFERPSGSFVWRDGDVRLLDDIAPTERRDTVGAFTEDRHPILSFGANASPTGLGVKFSHFPDAEDREALVLTGYLHDLDVGAIANPGLAGYMPATLFASPGTAVRAAVVWATSTQVTQLAWSELSYRIGRLDNAIFEMDEADIPIGEIFAFISRLGALCIDGSPVALAAIPAKNRTSAALTQRELLDVAARMVIGPDSGSEDLVKAIFDDMAAVTERASETMWPSSRQLQARWTPFPAAGSG